MNQKSNSNTPLTKRESMPEPFDLLKNDRIFKEGYLERDSDDFFDNLSNFDFIR